MRRSAAVSVLGLCVAFLASPVGAADIFSLLLKRATKYQAEQPTTREYDPLSYYEPRVAPPNVSLGSAWAQEDLTPKRKFFANELSYRINTRRFEARYAFGGTAVRARFGFDGDTHVEFSWPYLLNNGQLKLNIAEGDGNANCELLFVFAF